MSNHKCHVDGCDVKTSRRDLMCGKHWGQLPEAMRRLMRPRFANGSKANQQTLRAHPSKEWLAVAFEKFGLRLRVTPYEQMQRRAA